MKSVKTNAHEWISSLYERNSIKLEGFADDPEVYLRATLEGLDFGYEATVWDGYLPAPNKGMYKRHVLTWQTLQTLSKEQQQELIFDRLIKTINTRKRQFRKCQFCGEKIAFRSSD